jgi:hypothetical protein
MGGSNEAHPVDLAPPRRGHETGADEIRPNLRKKATAVVLREEATSAHHRSDRLIDDRTIPVIRRVFYERDSCIPCEPGILDELNGVFTDVEIEERFVRCHTW